MSEQAFQNGFIKRAQEYGLNQATAYNLLKEAQSGIFDDPIEGVPDQRPLWKQNISEAVRSAKALPGVVGENLGLLGSLAKAPFQSNEYVRPAGPGLYNNIKHRVTYSPMGQLIGPENVHKGLTAMEGPGLQNSMAAKALNLAPQPNPGAAIGNAAASPLSMGAAGGIKPLGR